MRTLFLSVTAGLSFLGPGVATWAAAAEPSQPATLLIYLPADAKLTFDDQPTTSTSATRQFITPPLEPGKTYYYILQAQTTRGDQTVTVRQKVQVRAGEETTVSMWPAEQHERPGTIPSAAYYLPDSESFSPMSSGGFPPAYLLGKSVAPRVSRFSEQSPAYGAGPPGSYARWATGTLIDR